MQHRNIITEEQISRALNESIDEFMLEEGAISDLSKRAIGKVARGAWNGVKAYMDWRTKGAWNKKYGQYVNGTGATTSVYYFNKWLNFHLNAINEIDIDNRDPNRTKSKINWFYDNTGKRISGESSSLNYETVRDYVIANITPQNFNTWIGKFIKNRKEIQSIDAYISQCAQNITDLKTAKRLLNIWSYLDWASKWNKQQKQQQQQTNNTNEADSPFKPNPNAHMSFKNNI